MERGCHAPAATEPDHSAEFSRIPLRSVRAAYVTFFRAGVIISRELQPKNRQVRVVYKHSNFAGKPPFSATFGHARRAFQPAVQAQHVVAAT